MHGKFKKHPKIHKTCSANLKCTQKSIKHARQNLKAYFKGHRIYSAKIKEGVQKQLIKIKMSR